MPSASPALPSPKSVLRYTSFFCLLGWGASAIAVAGHVGTQAPWFEAARQLAMQFFFGLFAFGFFYVQHSLVQRFAGRDLSFPLGYVQAFGGLALLLAEVSTTFTAVLADAPRSGAAFLDSYGFTYICILGEAAFLANVLWSYLLKEGLPPGRQAARAARPRIPTAFPLPGKIAQHWDWSSSPAAIFGAAAAFFLLAGFVLVFAAPMRLPILKNGALSYVSPGYLWLPLAAPFAVFAAIYWWVEQITGWKFDRSATRIHFFCTILAVVEAIRIYWSWSVTLANPRPAALPTARDFFGVLAFLALAAGALLWNMLAGARATPRPA
jgi:hypothetical protein